jgi:hypothetical protein
LKRAVKGVPLWLIVAVLAAAVGVAVAATIIGTVKMPWQVTAPPPPPPTASMSPSEVTLEIGTLYFGQTKTADPSKVAALTVENGAVNVIVSLGGDYSGLSAISVIFELVKDGNVVYQASVDQSKTSATISGVAPGTYDVYVGFTVTAGNVEGSGEAVLTVSYEA